VLVVEPWRSALAGCGRPGSHSPRKGRSRSRVRLLLLGPRPPEPALDPRVYPGLIHEVVGAVRGFLDDMQVVRALIGLAVPGRPIGPWSRRTGPPKASATRRDRNPDAHKIAHGTRHDTPG
jgi:hypothetical protein